MLSINSSCKVERSFVAESDCSEFLVHLRFSTIRVNFIDVLQADFTFADHKSAKKDCQLYCLFGAFGIFALEECWQN